MNQNRLSIPVWSYAMEVYPPERIVELGSYNGGFTTAIGVHAWLIGAKLYSFDVMKAPDEKWMDLSKFLGIEFYTGDVFAGFSDLIRTLISTRGRTYLLCDNGEKPKEFKTFCGSLKSGDVIGVHDFASENWPWGEIKQTDVADEVSRFDLSPFMQEHFDLTGWLVFKKL